MDSCQGPQQVCRVPAQIQESDRFVQDWFKYPTAIKKQRQAGSVPFATFCVGYPIDIWLDKWDMIGYAWIILLGALKAAPTSLAQSWLQMAFVAGVLVHWLG